MRTARLALSFAVVACLFGCGGDGASAAEGGGKKPHVVVIPKGTTHTFWQAVKAGAEQAGTAHGLEVTFKGPLQENDRADQIDLMRQFVGDGVAGIALAPLDHTALLPAVQQAKASGIPVVIFDSALDGEAGKDFDGFVATDNEVAGRLGGEELVRLLSGKGKVVLLRYQVGSASTEARERGFLEAAKAGGLEVLVDNRYAGATIGEAKTAALNLADELKQADGVFCPCEPVTNGMILALDQLGLAGKLKFVGFDASAPIIKALALGKVDALVVQDPRRMGELAVEQLRTLLDGGTVPPVTDTGSVLVTKANMNDEKVAPLLK